VITPDVWPHYVTTVPVLPPCDVCGSPAEADAKTVHGPWAYLCSTHFAELGLGLGLGLGQRLTVGP